MSDPATSLDVLDRHERIALLLSGGRDSLACLYLVRRWWTKVTVVWVNSGDNFPETERQMERIRAMVPHFFEAKSDVREDIRVHGIPVGALPVANSPFGRMVGDPKALPMRPFQECCGNNKWVPAMFALRSLGVTLVIRGDRASERRRAPMTNGHNLPGIDAVFPVWYWTTEEVAAYLDQEAPGETPDNYRRGCKSSLDCVCCTAYLNENGPGFWRYLAEEVPGRAPELARNLLTIRDALCLEFHAADQCLTDLRTAMKE